MTTQSGTRFLLVLCLIATGLLALVVASFAGSFFAAAVFAGVLHPLQERATRRLRRRTYLAAGLLTAGVIVSVCAPIAFTSTFLFREGQKVVRWVEETTRTKGLAGVVEPLPDPLEPYARRLLDLLPVHDRTDGTPAPTDRTLGETERAPGETENDRLVGDTGSGSASERDAKESGDPPDVSGAAMAAASAFRRLANLLVRFGIFALALFFLLAEGPRLVEYLIQLVPLEKERSRNLLSSFRQVSTAVLLSALATAAVQTLVAAIGYLIAGVPAIALLLSATFLFSFIPAVGGAGVVITAGVYLCLSGRLGMGIFLIVWGIGAVGTIDNVVKPWVAKDRAHLPASIVFFAMICGLTAFGPLGLVAGPLIVTFFHVVSSGLREERVRAARRSS